AGRFASARQAFAETLELDPTDGRAALNLSLALIAGGDGEAARAVLGRHADHIPATDLGLAMALAGGTGEGVKILSAAAREPEASPKTRQNLALALALAGQWDMARMAASAASRSFNSVSGHPLGAPCAAGAASTAPSSSPAMTMDSSLCRNKRQSRSFPAWRTTPAATGAASPGSSATVWPSSWISQA
ncbi:tetratricopeptide repeat protein, partial [Staphylococcus aureus]|nr:tetratricopeptide repeat protein [Staphylococcus aureus]